MESNLDFSAHDCHALADAPGIASAECIIFHTVVNAGAAAGGDCQIIGDNKQCGEGSRQQSQGEYDNSERKYEQPGREDEESRQMTCSTACLFVLRCECCADAFSRAQ